MGVPGLWDVRATGEGSAILANIEQIIRHTGKPEALAQLALEGFRREQTANELKGAPCSSMS